MTIRVCARVMLPAHLHDVTDDVSRSGKYKYEYNKRTKSKTRCHNVFQHRDHIASNIVKVGG